eukprot:COSAG02_NODE_55458_length_290_cov_1.073298_1_plen_36_part_10
MECANLGLVSSGSKEPGSVAHRLSANASMHRDRGGR